jgi:hypothetical protein
MDFISLRKVNTLDIQVHAMQIPCTNPFTHTHPPCHRIKTIYIMPKTKTNQSTNSRCIAILTTPRLADRLRLSCILLLLSITIRHYILPQTLLGHDMQLSFLRSCLHRQCSLILILRKAGRIGHFSFSSPNTMKTSTASLCTRTKTSTASFSFDFVRR